jgi:hypothetical protein
MILRIISLGRWALGVGSKALLITDYELRISDRVFEPRSHKDTRVFINGSTTSRVLVPWWSGFQGPKFSIYQHREIEKVRQDPGELLVFSF